MMGIYCIKNKINNRLYIGKSKDIYKRWKEHRRQLELQKHHNCHLQSAWNIYGENNFEFSIIKETDDKNKLNELENYYIKYFEANQCEYGYNLTSGGEGSNMNQEVKDKIGFSNRGVKSKLSVEDVMKIKQSMWCGISRKELSKIFNVSEKVLTSISTGANFNYVLPELSDDIHNLKQKILNERNSYILYIFNKEKSIAETVRKTGYSTSIVEKCVYNRTDNVKDNSKKQQEIYDSIHKLLKLGFNKNEIHQITGIPATTVYRYAKNETNPYNVLPFKKISEEMGNEIIKLHKLGHTTKSLALKYNVSLNTIEKILTKYKYTNTELTKENKESLVM